MGCVCLCVCVRVHACTHTLSHVLLFDPMDCSPPGFSVYGILHTRTLEWIAMPSEDLPDPETEPESLASPALAGIFFTAVS